MSPANANAGLGRKPLGPLAGLRILEIASIGPGPMAAMLLADMGADVVRVEKPGAADIFPLPRRLDITARSRRSLALDLKHPHGLAALRRLLPRFDGLIEGFRPGAMERLGLAPDDCRAINPRLVYGRMTGFGQSGPLAQTAGHDLNYLGVSGILLALGREGEPPMPPLNLIADYGGGAMFLAFGMVCALLERERSGLGQVVDAAMLDGAAVLASLFGSLRAAGLWSERRSDNFLDGGAPFYACYATRDARFVAVAALEPKFFAELARRLDLEGRFVRGQYDRALWPELRARLAAIFATRTRDEWRAALEGTETCVSGVLSFAEAPDHPQNRARDAYADIGGQIQPAPAPRFSRSANDRPRPPAEAGANSRDVLWEAGFAAEEIDALLTAGAIAEHG